MFLTFNYQNYHPRENGMVKYYYQKSSKHLFNQKAQLRKLPRPNQGVSLKFGNTLLTEGESTFPGCHVAP